MFSVSGKEGEVFRGSLEHLLETHRVVRLRNTRGIRQEGEEESPVGDTSRPDDKRYQAAATAYAANLKTRAARGPIYHAYQVMSRDVFILQPEASVEQAWRALAERGVGQAPVVDRDQRLVGLVSREHLLKVLNAEGGNVRDALSRTVADVMDTPVVTAEPVSDVRRIARVMLEYALPALPVVDPSSGALTGIVSRGDILRVVVTDPPLTLWG